MLETKIFQFRKPEGKDPVSIDDLNTNWDKAEHILKGQRRQIRFLCVVTTISLIGKIGGVHLRRLPILEGLNFLLECLSKACRKFLQYE